MLYETLTGDTILTLETMDAFIEFHEIELPERLSRGDYALCAREASRIGALAIRTPAGAYTYRSNGESIEVVAGDADARSVIGIDLDSFSGLLRDVDTPIAMLYSSRVEAVRGNPMRFIRWEPILRAMFHGRPLYDPSQLSLLNKSGDPLDAQQKFTLEELLETPDELAHFLKTAGFLMVGEVFSSEEVDELFAAAQRLEREAVEGDGSSWWGRDSSGEAILTRVLRGAEIPSLDSLHDDARIKALVSLAEIPAVANHRNELDGTTVLWKRPDIKEGLADLPWHRDCGLGGHADNCPMFILTVCLNDGSAEAGQLRVLPGSHLTSFPFVENDDPEAPLGVAVQARKGDVSVHYSDVMHVSPPPTSTDGPFRVSILLTYGPEKTLHHAGGRHYNDALLGADDGQVKHLRDL
ncbi:MAG: hypothetical protein F2877_03980 [Actinobacteria bacterium]|uniref:Unannotated protein n=1 Tax=freshwater metagenome TaxID=449393 RepID=A0A6J7NCI2_9ZZZZ|nr:hypothetical protein [Actinomycetota bacterium]